MQTGQAVAMQSATSRPLGWPGNSFLSRVKIPDFLTASMLVCVCVICCDHAINQDEAAKIMYDLI